MSDKPGYQSLGPGSSIALVAPSSSFEAGPYEKGVQILQAAGYEVVSGKSIFKKDSYLAGTDLERLQDLTQAVLDPKIEAIICIRGGYGSGRLLPRIPFSDFSRNPKLFIGHSDITFLHLGLMSRARWTTFHGPNLIDMSQMPERAESVLKALSGQASYEWVFDRDQVLRSGTVNGRVLGGNLSCLAHLVGTPYMPDMDGALLLIEDCGEALYRLDRMMNHLKLAGILARLGAILLGEFTGCAENTDICTMIMDLVREYNFPVVHSLPFGHGPHNEVIAFGPPFVLDTNERVLKILEAPVAR
ncbi:MAG: LD-carboxypeptidase [Syntrophobacteraceae bacterium]|jgi:muramoyltetrapeptide carboxypeptidase